MEELYTEDIDGIAVSIVSVLNDSDNGMVNKESIISIVDTADDV